MHIVVPCFQKETDEDTNQEKEILTFFKAMPVFRVEDTDGEKLDYQNIKLPNLPLVEKAKQWGISVKAIPGNYRYHGYYSSQRKQIAIATPEESVFFHEIAHYAEFQIMPNHCWQRW